MLTKQRQMNNIIQNDVDDLLVFVRVRGMDFWLRT